jgi:hypothetical protein
MLREYLSNIADKFRTYLDSAEPINAQDFAGKVEDVAVRYNQLGFTSGYNQGLEECQSKHFVGTVMGSGTSILTIPIPFKPDMIMLSTSVGYGETKSSIQHLVLDFHTCGYLCGCMSFIDDVRSQRFSIYTTNAVFTRPRFEYEDGKVILTMSSNSNPTVVFKPNSIFFVNAVKLNPTPKQRVTAEIYALPNESSGETIQYTTFKINENFTTEEWESLIATKPNWTFALV